MQHTSPSISAVKEKCILSPEKWNFVIFFSRWPRQYEPHFLETLFFSRIKKEKERIAAVSSPRFSREEGRMES